MEPANPSPKLTKHFHKKTFQYIDDKRQALIHNYKYIDTLSVLKFGEVLRDVKNKNLQPYASILRRTKYLKYLNNQNLYQIPSYVFSILKHNSQSLKRIDTLEFRHIQTIEKFKKIEAAILLDIFPSEVRMNKRLSHVMLGLQMFAPRANADQILQRIALKPSALSNSNQIKEFTVETEDIVYDFHLKSSREFQKLASEFDLSSLYLNSTVKIDKTNFPVDFFATNAKNIHINVPISGSFIFDELESNKKSLDHLESFVYSESNYCKRNIAPKADLEDAQPYENQISNFSFLNDFKKLKTVALRLDCTRFTKNLPQVINSILLPESMEILGLQLINCDLNNALEEFALSSTDLGHDSLISSCFKPFIENFSSLANLKIFAFEVYHPANDAKVPLLLSYEILKMIPQQLNGLLLEYENCRLAQDQLEFEPILCEILRLEPSKLTVALPFGSSTNLADEITIKKIVAKSEDILFTSCGKDAAALIAKIEGNDWYFGHGFGKGSLGFSFADFFDVDVTIRHVIDKFTQKDSSAVIMPYSLIYLLQHILYPKMETEIKYAKVSSKECEDSKANKLDVLIQGETRAANKVLKLDMITSLSEGIDTF